MGVFMNLVGTPPFTRLTVQSRAPNAADGATVWNCVCSCGNEIAVRASSLQTENTRSCGCLHRETTSKTFRKHGKSRSKEYQVWRTMKKRCTDQNGRWWHIYGGRGIRVCKRWLDPKSGFENFLADMGPRPQGMQLDRRENNGNYTPKNCRWATPKQNSRNTRRVIMLTFQGRTQALGDWEDELGFKHKTLYSRIHSGWSVKRALTTPPPGKK
jgi:hypothetical protein